MLNKKYFDDAFPLHDQTKECRKIFCSNEVYGILRFYKNDDLIDHIGNLYKRWGKFTRIFHFQPLNEIRGYFGEFNAIYFAWLGTFIQTLITPAIVGLIFFIIGQVLR